MLRIWIVLFAIMTAAPASAAILIENANGSRVNPQKTLAQLAVAPQAAGRTVVVTSALTSTFSNISSATVHKWPTDRQLKFEAGASLANTTKFDFGGGYVDAGRRQIFTGTGRIMGLKTAFPEWWGTDAAAIQSAINSITNGIVSLDATTYTLSRRVFMTQVGGAPACDAILVPKSGVSVVGSGYNSVLKIAANHTGGGDWVLFGTQNLEAIDNITFSNFRVDGNAANNLHPGGGAVRRCMAFWLFKANNVKIENMWFENNGGTNTIKLGSDSMTYRGINCSVRNNIFKYQGGVITGNEGQNDHSTLYLSGDSIAVDGNTFIAADAPFDWTAFTPTLVVAAIELHGVNISATNNKIVNYTSMGYSVNDAVVGGSNHIWAGNIGNGITSLGISLWSLAELTNINIAHNIINLDSTVGTIIAGIYQSRLFPDTTTGITGINISNNSLLCNNNTPDTSGAGIYLTAVENAVIAGNTIEKWASSGIRVLDLAISDNAGAASLQNKNISITGNVIRDISLLGSHAAINLDNIGATTMDGIRISGNQITATTTLIATRPTNRVSDAVYFGQVTAYDPPAIPSGGGFTNGSVTVLGAKVGDTVQFMPPYDLQGFIVSAYVWADNAVRFSGFNPTAGTIDLGAGDWKFRVGK